MSSSLKSRCSKCKAEKSLRDFSPDKRRMLGVVSACKECENAAAKVRWATMNPEKKARYMATDRKYYLTNRKELLVKMYSEREATPEKQREMRRRFYIKNRAKIRALQIKRRPFAAELESRRRARKRGATIGDVVLITRWALILRKKERVPCFWCRRIISGKRAHVDHMQPLSKGGSHAVENLCASCSECNFAKHDKTVEKWNKQIAEPILL